MSIFSSTSSSTSSDSLAGNSTLAEAAPSGRYTSRTNFVAPDTFTPYPALTTFLTFHTKTDYLAWRHEWRCAYRQLTEEIRAAKRSRKRTTSDQQLRDAVDHCRTLRNHARWMLLLRAHSKERAASQYQAAQERAALTEPTDHNEPTNH